MRSIDMRMGKKSPCRLSMLHVLIAWCCVLVNAVVYADVCSTVAHPLEPGNIMSSCLLAAHDDLLTVPDMPALELRFTQLTAIDFAQFTLARPSLTYLNFDMTYLSYARLRQAMNGITAPNLATLTIKRDLDRDASSLYLDAQTFANLPMVQTLNLKGVGIGTLHAQALRGLEGINVLDLSENYLNEIPENSLQDCKNLTILRLQNNFIEPQNLLENSFTGPTALHWLNLENNKISYVPRRRFLHLDALSILVLTNNDVQFVEDEAFKGLTSLHYLSLSNNKLSAVPTEALKDIPDLYSLDLSRNDLNQLLDGGFESLSTLEVLYLQYTNLQQIDGENFRGLEKLRELHLKSNHLRSVNASTFKHIPEAIQIDLSENKLRDIAVDTFTASTPHLEVLFLSGNELKHLDEGVFDGLDQLDQLYLDNNRWNCTCELLWLFQWINDNEDKLSNDHQLYTIQCSTPSNYQHYKFYDLRLSFVMDCQEDLTLLDITTASQQKVPNTLTDRELAGIIVGAIIFCIIILVIILAIVYVRRKKSYRFWKPSQSDTHNTSTLSTSSLDRRERLARHRTPSWCKDPEAAAAPPKPSAPPQQPPPAYTPEEKDNKTNDVFAFDNMALETSMMSKNGISPSKSNASGPMNGTSPTSPTQLHFPVLTSSPRDHTSPPHTDVHVHINVDINKNMHAT